MQRLPFEIIQEAINFSEKLALRDDSGAKKILFLIAGVWRSENPDEPLVLLSWSPLQGKVPSAGAVDLLSVAKQWVLDGLASAMILLDEKASELFNKESPSRYCWNHLSKGEYMELIISLSIF